MSKGENIVRVDLASSLTTLYKVPKGKKAEVTSIRAVNRSTADCVIYIYFVGSSGTAGDANAFWYKMPMPADKQVLVEDTFAVVGLEDSTIQAYTTGSITLHIDGLEVQA